MKTYLFSWLTSIDQIYANLHFNKYEFYVRPVNQQVE